MNGRTKRNWTNLLCGAVAISIFLLVSTAGAGEASSPVLHTVFGHERSAGTDTVFLRNGDRLSGKLLFASLNMQAVYGEIKVPREFIAGIYFGSGPDALDVIVTINFNKISGVIADKEIRLDRSPEGVISLPKEKVATIAMRKSANEAEKLEKKFSTQDVVTLANSDLLAGLLQPESFTMVTPYAEVPVLASQIEVMQISDGTTLTVTAKLKSGDVVSGDLQRSDFSLRADPIGSLTLYKASIRAIRFSQSLRAVQTHYETMVGSAAGWETLRQDIIMAGDMIYIPGGPFEMGKRNNGDNETKNEIVDLPGFYIDRYEVTNAHYKEFVDATGTTPPLHWVNGKIPAGLEKHPVVHVSWFDAEAYAKWAGKRLPTSTEWEKAARGTDVRTYPWGNEFEPLYCNWDGTGIRATTPVGTFPLGRSFYGVDDMAGNVWEWCQDSYKGARDRIIRGGSWQTTEKDKKALRCFNFSWNPANAKDKTLGFRCVRSK
jgi:formylglycine-generating enzyme required for sulfatase activity